MYNLAGTFFWDYSQTPIKWPSVKQSPSIMRSLIKFPKMSPHTYCKLDLY